jgi:hypothetical protein
MGFMLASLRDEARLPSMLKAARMRVEAAGYQLDPWPNER